MDYVLLKCSSLEELQRRVIDHLNMGYETTGGACITKESWGLSDKIYPVYFQAMVKYS